MKQKIILTDADGCLLNWKDSFISWMRNNGFVDNNDNSEYKISKIFNISESDALQYVKEFNESDHIKYLKPYGGAEYYIKVISNLGYKFHVITSLSASDTASQNRHENLNKLFGKEIFEKIICLPLGSNKAEILTEYKDTNYFWIEDHPYNAQDGLDLGLKSIIFNHSYNQNINVDCPRINTWEDFYFFHLLPNKN